VTAEKTPSGDLLLIEAWDKHEYSACLKYRGRTRVIARGEKQIRRLKDMIAFLEKNYPSPPPLTGRFFSAASLYFLEEQHANYALLARELSSPQPGPLQGPGPPPAGGKGQQP
jgi:hypothetical protein